MNTITTIDHSVNGLGAAVLSFPSSRGDPENEKPYLIVELGEMATLAEQAMRILAQAEVDIFQRGTALVRPIVGQGVNSEGKTVRYPILFEVNLTFMRLMLCQYIDWYKPDARAKKSPIGKGYRKIDAPEEIARAIISSAGQWPFRTIAGVISTPTLRFDGSILSQPGYDPRTHLYLMSDVVMPPIPENPTRADAMRSLALLDDLLTEFPFVNEASKSVSRSAMLSTVARAMLDVAPAHGARAPTPGTGKSYLFDIVAMIALGEKCPVISVSSDSDGETEKRIIGSAISGQPIINLDNVNGTLGGDALCQLVERPICNLRVLGRSEPVRVENRVVVFFNGNNCKVMGDMTRRVILAELDARMEKPAERKFKEDPIAKIKEDRGAYIAACMTILRAYIVAGRPKQDIVPMGSFEQWSDTVRSALIWLGCEDPCETIAKAREEDPELQKLAEVIAAMKPHANGKEQALPCNRIIELGNRTDGIGPQYPELHSFVQEFVNCGGKPSASSMGVGSENSGTGP